MIDSKNNSSDESASNELAPEELAAATGGAQLTFSRIVREAPPIKTQIDVKKLDLNLNFDPQVILRRLNVCASSQPNDPA